jgi:hypothetical protein
MAFQHDKPSLSDIRQIPGGCEARIALSIGLGNGKYP